jgi:hypothetical protein
MDVQLCVAIRLPPYKRVLTLQGGWTTLSGGAIFDIV